MPPSFLALLAADGAVLEVGGAADQAFPCAGDPVCQRLWEAPCFAYSPAVQAELRAAVLSSAATGRLVTTLQLASGALEAVRVEVTRLAGGRVAVQVSGAEAAEEALAALRDSQRVLATLLGNLPGMVYRCRNDADWTLVFASDGCRELTGYPAETLIRKDVDFASLIHPDDVQAVWAGVQAGVAERRPYRLEYRIRDHAGAEKWVWEQGRGIEDSEGRLLCLEGFIADITPLREAEERALRAERLHAVGLVAGGVAHDFNNLLTGILGWSELLRGRAPSHPWLEQPLEELTALCRQGGALARQLLAFGSGQVLERRVFELGRWLEALAPTLRGVLGAEVALTLEVAPGDPAWVELDPGQAEQLLLSLALNARDAMRPGGGELLLSLRGARPPGSVELLVADTGRGMDEAARAGAREPFFTTKPKGAGFGLALAADVVERVGGELELTPRPGGGTQVRLRLPARAPAPADQEPKATARRDPSAGSESCEDGTVLVVEDNDAALRVVVRILAAQVPQVVAEAAPAEALARIEAGLVPDVLLTDVVLPGMQGPDLARAVRAARPGVEVVYMSGYAPDPRVQQELDAGEAAFLAKPFGMEELLAKVGEALRRVRERGGK
ncbi:MAG: response regulator [Planctomycetota bacterium]